jgi:hypothetical protein
VVTLVQVKLPEPLLQPTGSGFSPEVTVRALAGLPSSVTKVTLSGVVLPVRTPSEFKLAVAFTVLFVVATYGILTVPVFA